MAAETKLKIVVQARDEASAKLRGVGGAMSRLKGSIGPLLPILGIAGLAGAFGFVVKSAADFEAQLADISTLLSGDSTQAIEGFKKGIEDLAKVTPKDPKELGAAAYQIVSAGITDTAEAMKVLKESSRLAIAGLGTTEEATDLLTSALNSFGISTDDAGKTAAILFNTVKQGKTTVSQLAQSFGMVAPIAAEMGVSLEELQAATAALTTTGLQTSVAQSQLRSAMASLLKPTKEAKDLFDELGVTSFKELITKSGGLVGAFGALKEATKGNEETLAKAAGSVEGLNAILSLTGAQSEAFTTTLDSMKASTLAFDEAVEKQNATAKAQFQILKNQLNVELTKLGMVILPHLTNVMKGLPHAIDVMFIKPFNAVVKVLTAVFLWFIKVQDALVNLTSKVSSFVGGVGGAIGGALGKVGSVLGFAQGGIVPGQVGVPRLAVVHGGERITPPGRTSGMITINISGTFLSEDVAEDIGNLMLEKLKTNVRF